MRSTLCLEGWQLSLHLGVTETERAKPQCVTITLQLDFEMPPRAIETDALSDTFCYGKLCEQLGPCLQKKTYCLLEHLAHDIYQYLQIDASNIKHRRVTVSKNPPLSYLDKASFTLSD